MPDEAAGRFVITPKGAGNQGGNFALISHALHNVSTLADMTAPDIHWLRTSHSASERRRQGVDFAAERPQKSHASPPEPNFL